MTHDEARDALRDALEELEVVRGDIGMHEFELQGLQKEEAALEEQIETLRGLAARADDDGNQDDEHTTEEPESE